MLKSYVVSRMDQFRHYGIIMMRSRLRVRKLNFSPNRRVVYLDLIDKLANSKKNCTLSVPISFYFVYLKYRFKKNGIPQEFKAEYFLLFAFVFLTG